tara:strand:+ start:531 stop:728 length:198 start_codon:yes stop_codon:yes gene_type:complete
MKPSIRLMTYSTKKNTWCYRQGFYQIPKNPKRKNTKVMRLRYGKQGHTTEKCKELILKDKHNLND